MTDDRRVDDAARTNEQMLAAHLRALADANLDAATACPEPTVLAAYATGSDGPETNQQVRAHLLFCDPCNRELLAIGDATADVGAGIAEAVVAAVARRVRELVRFEMPTYEPIGATRGGAGGTDDRLVGIAMAAYVNRRYADAINHLEQVTKAGAWADADVYLGACLLHDGRPDAAAAALDRVLKRRPRAGTAQWLRAQCDLAIGDDTAARERLRALAAADGPYQDEAAALLGRLVAVSGEA